MLYRRVNIINTFSTFFSLERKYNSNIFHQLKKKDFIITTTGFEEILRQIKEEMENAPTKEENEELKNKLEAQISKLKEVKLQVSIVCFQLIFQYMYYLHT
jgi:DNA-binding transcriptional regulator YhcF (GntR family)